MKINSLEKNYAVILKNYAFAINSGLEQQDYAMLYGSSAGITILFQDNEFVFTGKNKDCIQDDKKQRINYSITLNL